MSSPLPWEPPIGAVRWLTYGEESAIIASSAIIVFTASIAIGDIVIAIGSIASIAIIAIIITIIGVIATIGPNRHHR